MGTLYDVTAGIQAVSHRFNSGAVYGSNLVGNCYMPRFCRKKVPFCAEMAS